MSDTPRLRMFAGPNGSGKSTIKSVISPQLLGVYINPDEIEQEIGKRDFLDLAAFGVHTNREEILSFFRASTLLGKAGLLDEADQLRFSDGKLDFYAVVVNAYFASVAADFLRQKLIEAGTSFTFETVMSSTDKVALLQKAQQRGYRTYLYYLATDDPVINISRVRHRVKMGGHPVPEDKIVSRYERSLNLLFDALRHTNRAYIFDNSKHQPIWLAEITDGKVLEIKTDRMPAWFKKAVWDKFAPHSDQPQEI
ncbi:MAG: zeta toxin family protein [Acidobacteriota bacterium]